MNFMKNALKDKPAIPFRVPNSVNLIKIDTKTGYYPTPDSNPKDLVLEAFKPTDKIEKFENEISDDEIEEFSDMLGEERSNRPDVITNIQNKEKDNEYIRQKESENYDIEFENNDELNQIVGN